jgi:acylpyruvate hydrolase
MRLITYASGPNGLPRLGVRVGHRVLDVEAASRVDGEPLPASLKGLLREGRGAISRVQALAKAAQSSAGRYSPAMLEEKAIRFLPPVTDPDRFAGRESEELAALLGHNGRLPRPSATRLDCEPALVFVIGRRALGVSADDDEMDYIAGVTLMIEIIDADLGRCEAAVVGPEMVTLDEIRDPYDLWISCSVNGVERTRVNTGDQVAKMGEILQHLSRTSALEPSDLFPIRALQTPRAGRDGAGLKAGDMIESSIEGLATLRTTIAP